MRAVSRHGKIIPRRALGFGSSASRTRSRRWHTPLPIRRARAHSQPGGFILPADATDLIGRVLTDSS